MLDPNVPAADNHDESARIHDLLYALGHYKDADKAFAREHYKRGNYLTSATLYAQYLLRSTGILTSEEKKELRVIFPPASKMVKNAKRSNGPKVRPESRLRSKAREAPKRKPKIKKPKKAKAKFKKPMARALSSGLAKVAAAVTDTTSPMKPVTDWDNKQGVLTVCVPFTLSDFIPAGSTTLALTAGQVVGLLPVSPQKGLVISNQFSTNATLPAKGLDCGPVADQLAGFYQQARCEGIEIVFENSTAATSTNAAGRMFGTLVDDVGTLGDLESGPQLISTLSQQSTIKSHKPQFQSVSDWDPHVKNTTMKFSPAPGFTPGRWLKTSTLPSSPIVTDYQDRANGVIVIGCEQDLTLGPTNVAFVVWVKAKWRFRGFVLRDRNNSNRVLSPLTSITTTANAGNWYGFFTTSAPPKYHNGNPKDLRSAFQLNKVAVVQNPSTTYAVDLSQLCGPNESVSITFRANNTNSLAAGFVGLASGALSTMTVNSGAAALTPNAVDSAGFVASATYNDYSIEVTPTSSPCWVTPVISCASVNTYALSNPLLELTVNHTPIATANFVYKTNANDSDLVNTKVMDALNAQSMEDRIVEILRKLAPSLLPEPNGKEEEDTQEPGNGVIFSPDSDRSYINDLFSDFTKMSVGKAINIDSEIAPVILKTPAWKSYFSKHQK